MEYTAPVPGVATTTSVVRRKAKLIITPNGHRGPAVIESVPVSGSESSRRQTFTDDIRLVRASPLGARLGEPTPLISAAVLRRREFLADASGVELTRFPDGLIRALEEIQAHPSTARAASFDVRGLFFVNTVGEGVLAQWLGSHPSVAERVERLQHMGRSF